MMDNEEIGGNLPVFSVGELSSALKRTVEDAFALVRVRGEISGFKRAASGHLYMALKDEDAVMDAVCWRGTASRLGLQPEDGMEVIATGRLTTYPGRSKYQIVIESLELAGEGALLKLLEDRRRKLAAEGLFDQDAKEEPPFLPRRIGIVTSPTGAVLRDILHRLSDRFPCPVSLWPVVVQGDAAAEQVAAAIEGFNRLVEDGDPPRPDVIIVARGGGSLEDLMAFNEEVVVRAAAASDIPLISAVGHETDTTLIDFAADLRAPTPTAAAELAVPVRGELLAQVLDDGARLVAAMTRLLDSQESKLEGLARGLIDPRRRLDDLAQRLDDRAERLDQGLATWLDRKQASLAQWAARLPDPRPRLTESEARLKAEGRALDAVGRNLLREPETWLTHLGKLLDSYSYQKVLERGFTLVRDEHGKPLTSISGIASGQALTVTFQDGDLAAVATGGPPPKKPKRKSKKSVDQGDLF
ncbi:exodeoxyribonuclease VII large subunit [Magnetospira sp. QH-2]|uniref:exodeoxyribonuclease VII large subunit n=1 Tax=Magnetospira sp. (strain QH-2) TaxID=1288970 RepID=UPI0003E80E7F|nr:exodeoxyribonuclease VII large subunit [Magnetospira sp. QH-2]CCQ74887.1 exonuclease VII, large subunit [Magnetospira sp. QH-2]